MRSHGVFWCAEVCLSHQALQGVGVSLEHFLEDKPFTQESEQVGPVSHPAEALGIPHLRDDLPAEQPRGGSRHVGTLLPVIVKALRRL